MDKYPGMQHLTFTEAEEFVERVLQTLPPNATGTTWVRWAVAKVYNQMVRETIDAGVSTEGASWAMEATHAD